MSKYSELPPPGVSPVAQLMRRRATAPIESFLHVESASGILLLVAAVVALAWANSPWAEGYAHFWHAKIAFTLGPVHFDKTLHFIVNDGLMTIFFFVVGLEIKREIVEGELSELRRASLPIAAAIGGMIVPAGIYLIFNTGTPTQDGWGVPMATDIAFAVGVLTLLGPRVPAALRILLLALAIIDDIGAILVIAIAYTSDLKLDGLILIGAAFAIIALLKRSGVRPATSYIPAGVILWIGCYRLGVHPTIGGVMLGLITPNTSWFGKEGFIVEAREAIDEFQVASLKDHPSDHELMAPLNRIADARREALSPVVRLQSSLHPWVAFLIMPIFAVANAGVNLSGIDFASPSANVVALGVFLGLVIGKPLGIVAVSWLAVKTGISSLPRGVGFRGVFIVGATAGIGFTMAIFIAELAFNDPAVLGVSKLAVLAASGIAAVVGLGAGWLLLPRELPEDIRHVTVAEAERSTEF